MDVRCERCQTEYELDDASIPEAGVPVQCTTCGYTFSVKRGADGRTTTARYTPTGGEAPGRVQAPSITREDLPVAPPTAQLILETEDGKVHRLRDVTTLQKWVVERRVTAADRLSRDGGGVWRELGQVEELAPFFSVVGEADRAKGKGATSPLAGAPSAPLANTPSSPPASPFIEAGRTRGVPPRLPPDASSHAEGLGKGRGGLSPLEAGAGRERLPNIDDLGGPGMRPGATVPLVFAEAEEILEPPSRRKPLLLVGALLLVAAAVGGYVLVGRGSPAPNATVPSTTAPVPKLANPPANTTNPSSVTDKPTGAGSGLAATGIGSAAAPAPGGTPPAPAQPIVAPAIVPVLPQGAEPGSAPGVEGSASKDDLGKSGPAKDKAPSYDKLVAEGDRLLENGQTNRAEKVYIQAIALKPDGVSALTGTGYVSLDRGRTQKALEIFQRALSVDGRHGPAIFGLAEAYRAQGDSASALNTYKHYLATAPTGSDASAARRQVHDLEAAARAGKEPEGP